MIQIFGLPSEFTPHPTHSPNSRHGSAIPQVFVESIGYGNFALLLRRPSRVHDERRLVVPLGSVVGVG